MRRIVEPRGLPPEDCELVLMRARGRTDVHAHLRGHSTFLVLGLKHGFPEPDGGVELGLQPVGVLEATPMHEEPHVAGEVFDVESCEIHAFYADPGKELFVVGFVHPRIRQGDGFDVVDYVRDAADPSMVRMVSGCW
ncbi:MAG: hypothetical protein HYV13_01140 [Candidatus Doudnabacteria bacterium]|nr:hypothetical protein [Candidatus Doudnabacteria bacterium]